MTADRYARSAVALHWAIAFLLLFQLGLGWHMTGLPRGATLYAAFQFHKSIGISVLLLSLARVGIRFLKPRPAPVQAGRLAGLLVKLVHLGLYGFMIVGPLTGWIVVSTAKVNIPTRLFGIVPWPHLPVPQAWHHLSEESHELVAWVGLALILLHVAGAIRHHLGKENHENVIGRMIPMVSRGAAASRAVPAALGAAGLLAICFLAPWLLYTAGQGEAGGDKAPTAETAPVTSEAAAPRWTVSEGGKLGFTASMNGTAIEGQFGKWSADIRFDPVALADSRLTVSVVLLSASAGNPDRDTVLKGPEFFGNAGGTAVFRSSSITHGQGDRYSAVGTLTMNGVSAPVTLTFDLKIDGDQAAVTGSTRLDRTTFGIGSGSWANTDQVAAGVDVTFDFSARRTG